MTWHLRRLTLSAGLPGLQRLTARRRLLPLGHYFGRVGEMLRAPPDGAANGRPSSPSKELTVVRKIW